MQYDSIILELMTRIKALEASCQELDQRVAYLEGQFLEEEPAGGEEAEQAEGAPHRPDGKQKMTEEMVRACYECALRLSADQGLDFGREITALADQTGVNRNSAIMYVYAVRAMLSGDVYKRAISRGATEAYFLSILQDFGTDGLAKAIRAARAHVAYRRQCGHKVDGLAHLCDVYEERL